jgi:hypothetical protein
MAVNTGKRGESALFVCGRCQRRFGRYRWSWIETSDGTLTFLNSRTRPRTGTGLYYEAFEDRSYIRVICKCGRNEKLGTKALGALSVSMAGTPPSPAVYL